MAKKFLVALDLGGNQIINTYANGFVVENQSSSTAVSIRAIQSTGGKGQLYYDTTASGLRYYDGTSWQTLANTTNTATASAINVTNTASNGTFSPIFVTGAGTGLTVYGATSGLTFNPSSGLLAATGFSGSGNQLTNLTGANVSGSVNSALATASVTVNNDTTTSTAQYLAFTNASTGSAPIKTTAASLTYIPSSGILAAPSFSGSGNLLTNLTGANVSGSVNSALATASSTITNDTTTSTAQYLTFTTASTGNAPLKTTAASLTYTVNTGTLVAPQFSGGGAGITNVNAATLGGAAPGAYALLAGANFTGAVSVATTDASNPLTISSAPANNINGGIISLSTSASSTGTTVTGGNINITTGVGKTAGVATGGNVNITTTASGGATGGKVIINSVTAGNIDNMIIGATTPVAASFSSASTSGNVTIAGALSASGTASFSGSVMAASFGGNGAGLTNLTAGQLTGTIPSTVLVNSTLYVGTTAIALNRASASQQLSGISSIVLPGVTSGSVTLVPIAAAGTASLTLPATTGTVALTSDIGNATITVSTTGGLSVNSLSSDTFTLNQSSNKTLALTTNATSANTVNTIVQRDSSGNFLAGAINGVTVASAATGFTVAGGTTSKTLTVSNSLTLAAANDTSTLNIGTGGTLGTAAFTNSTAYSASFSILGIASGGTNTNITPNGWGVFYYDFTNSRYASTASGTTGQVLTANTSGAPTWTSQSSLTAGTATNATNLSLTTASQNATTYIPFFSANSSTNQAASVTAGLSFNPSNNTLTATTFSGALSGNATTATTANNVAAGGAGQIVYNTAAGTTGFITAPSAANLVFTSSATNGFQYIPYTSASTANTFVYRDANARFQAADPSGNQDVATKAYVDTMAQGLNTHDAVVAATLSTDITNLTASYADGTAGATGNGLGVGAYLEANAAAALPTIDGWGTGASAWAVGDRILIKDYTGSSAAWNGIYNVTTIGSVSVKWRLTRALDADNSIAGEMSYGDYIFVINGGKQSGTGWVLTTKGTGTPTNSIKIGNNTTNGDAVTYTQFSGQGYYTGASGVAASGNVFSFAPATSGGLQTSVSGGAVKLPTNSGLVTDSTGLYIGAGTGFTLSGGTLNFTTTASQSQVTGVTANSSTYGVQRQVFTITGTAASATSFALAHNLNTRDVIVQVYQASTGPDTQYAEVGVDIVRTSTSTVTVAFATAPAQTTTYNVIITG